MALASEAAGATWESADSSGPAMGRVMWNLVEDLTQDFRWHSRPVVFDGDLDPIFQLTSPNVDLSGTTRFVDRLLRVR